MGIKLTKPERRNKANAVEPGKPEEGKPGGQQGGGGNSGGATGKDSSTDTASIRVVRGGKTQEARVAGLAPVDSPGKKKNDAPPIPAPAPAKKRQPKPKKAKASDGTLSPEMISNLLGVVFNLMSVRMGEHWKLSQTEAMALAEPTANILERYDLSKKAGAYADFIALGVAVSGIVIPKVMVEMSKPKKPKKGAIQYVESIQEKPAGGRDTENREAAASAATHPGVDRTDAASGSNAGIKQHLGSILSATY